MDAGIQFTLTYSESKLQFLDTLVQVKDHALQTDLYVKPTDRKNDDFKNKARETERRSLLSGSTRQRSQNRIPFVSSFGPDSGKIANVPLTKGMCYH